MTIHHLHAILFAADSPHSLEVLSQALGLSLGQTDQMLELLQERLAESGPIQLVRLAGGYQLATKPEYAEVVSALLKPTKARLSRGAMEALAVIAYQQPVTATEVEVVRGVNSDYSIRTLVERGLVEEVGRRPTPGRPILYGTTRDFLHQFKLHDLGELPLVLLELPMPSSVHSAGA